MAKYQNVTLPLTREDWMRLKEIAMAETKKQQYGIVTSTSIVKKLVIDFIENYENKETK